MTPDGRANETDARERGRAEAADARGEALSAYVNELATKQAEAMMTQHAFFTAVRAALYDYADRGEGFAIDILSRLEGDPWWGSRPNNQ